MAIKPIRILHVVGAMNRAGTETMLMNLYRSLDHDKVQFDFISYNASKADYDNEIMELGGKVIRLTRTLSLASLMKVIRENGPYKAIHCHTLFHCGVGVLAGRLCGIPIRIAHAHTTSDNNITRSRLLYMKLMQKLIMKFSTRLLACSKEAGLFLFGTHARYETFPNVINFKEFVDCPSELVNEFRNEEKLIGNIIIGHIGRFIEAKNHKFIIKVFKEIQRDIPKARLLLVGDGELRREMEELSREEGLINDIIFTGKRSDVPRVLNSIDLFIFPSKYEGLGLVLLEAQACGIPCLVSEAIQPEADLKLGLLTQMNLEEGVEAWCQKALDLVDKRCYDRTKIQKAFIKSGFSIEQGIRKIMQIYKIGDSIDEEDINLIL